MQIGHSYPITRNLFEKYSEYFYWILFKMTILNTILNTFLIKYSWKYSEYF